MRKYFLHFCGRYKPLLSGGRNTLNHAIMQISEKIHRQPYEQNGGVWRECWKFDPSNLIVAQFSIQLQKMKNYLTVTYNPRKNQMSIFDGGFWRVNTRLHVMGAWDSAEPYSKQIWWWDFRVSYIYKKFPCQPVVLIEKTTGVSGEVSNKSFSAFDSVPAQRFPTSWMTLSISMIRIQTSEGVKPSHRHWSTFICLFQVQ